MSGAGLIMDVLLAVLLVAALMFGVRLERRLKALRDGQAGFAAAVLELDQASRRADQGLSTLRGAMEEAHDELHDRILAARELKTQLETLIARAERMPVRAAPEAEPRMVREPAHDSRTREMRPLELLAERLAERPIDRGAPSRASIRNLDEDLFESAGARR